MTSADVVARLSVLRGGTDHAVTVMWIKVVAAFAAVYFIWGSTYLAIRFGVETIPPFMLIGTRFLVAGVLLYLMVQRGQARPTVRQWLHSFWIGAFMLGGGVGLVAVAARTVDSGIIALIVGVIPVWILVIEWFRDKAQVPNLLTVTGVVLGITGVAVLVVPSGEGHRVAPIGAGLLMVATISWSIGTVISRNVRVHDSRTLASAMNMISGGAVLMIFAFAAGEPFAFAVDDVSLKSFLAWVYLVSAGSMVVFSAYMWLVDNVSLSLVSSYAFVNPIVAVFLGWWLAEEVVGIRTFAAAVLVLGAIAALSRGRKLGSTRVRD